MVCEQKSVATLTCAFWFVCCCFFAKRYIFETVLAREAVREKMHDSANILIKDDKVFELTD